MTTSAHKLQFKQPAMVKKQQVVAAKVDKFSLAKTVRSGVSKMVQSSAGKWFTTTVKESATLVASVVATTVSFGLMLQASLWLDEHWLHPMLHHLVESNPVVGYMFMAAKCAALFCELKWWVKGVSKDCEQHHNHKHNKPQVNDPASLDVNHDQNGSKNH
jgi:hypothetical protein